MSKMIPASEEGDLISVPFLIFLKMTEFYLLQCGLHKVTFHKAYTFNLRNDVFLHYSVLIIV